MRRKALRTATIVLLAVGVPTAARAQAGMPDPSAMSGVPLASPDVAADSISVRVVRGGFATNLPGVPVEFTVDGRTEVISTDAEGRAVITGLTPGQSVRIVATVDDQRLESRPITVGTASGYRVALVALDPEAAALATEGPGAAGGPVLQGDVVLGPETRIVAEMRDDVLTIWYVLQILNTARSPVDIGGPLIFDLPRAARGTTVLEGSSERATANGSRIIVTGPFAPGETNVQAAFELPTSGPVARIEQQWPAMLQQVTVLVEQAGGFDIISPQVTQKRSMVDQGQPILVGNGPALGSGQTLELQITGLPYHPQWPRYLALTLAVALVVWGIWSAATARPRRVTA